MKKWLILFVFFPFSIKAQTQLKKLKRNERKEKIEIVENLKSHVSYLASDQLEGRRTGTKGEILAANYLVEEYRKIGLLPGNNGKYLQEFEYYEGKSYTKKSYFKINGETLTAEVDYFPLAYSANKTINSNTAIALKEVDNPWFLDLKDILEENKNNPHFDVNEVVMKESEKQFKKGANSLILFNSSSIVDNISFSKFDPSATLSRPVIYMPFKSLKKYFKDDITSYDIKLNITIENSSRTGRNIVGFINNNATHTIILGAHYDHLGFGEDKNALDTANDIHNGADDNASGSAALLEIARLLKTSKLSNHNYLIIHFSGEELGLIGSKYWLEHPTINISKNYMINMDMVGRYDTSHKLTIGGYGTSPTWGSVLPKLSSPLITKIDSSGTGPSDHASFYRKDIPVLFFFTGSHSDYHKASDDFDKINYEGMADVVRLIYNIIDATNSIQKLEFTKTKEPEMGRSTRFTVSLGVIPDYGFTGEGVRIDGVSQGKLAERIGLAAGDILIQLGDYKFTDVMSYMKALSKFKKGDATQLIIKRKEETLHFDISF
ncbi:MAG: M28 family peptidase [Chitinophagaceae bacterium]|nr:M28 family peptidase [Chitinophagaceae bacterium]